MPHSPSLSAADPLPSAICPLPSPIADDKLHTCSDIAKRLGYSTSCIWRAVQRIDFPPDEVTDGGLKLYRASRLPVLRAQLKPSRRQ